jgi:ribosome-associated protein
MIEITSSISIDENELRLDYIHASGPGGQNVNKVASTAQLRFDIRKTQSLTPDVKERLIKLAGNRVTKEEILIIEAKRYRTQEQNRSDAIDRLVHLVQKAVVEPRKRTATRPSAAARESRIRAKKQRGEIKRDRRSTPEDID